MKKLLCGLLVAMLSFSAFAQDYKVPRGRIDKYAGSKICKYEVRIGWGGYPLFEHNCSNTTIWLWGLVTNTICADCSTIV